MGKKKPTRYYLRWEDAALYAAELARAGGDPDNIFPGEIYADDEAYDTFPATVKKARLYAQTKQTSIFIYERLEIHRLIDDPQYAGYEMWDYEDNDCIADITDGKLSKYAI